MSDKCDYVLVPRIYSHGRKKRVCVKFNGIYDVVNNLFSNVKILDYNIDNLKFRYELFGFVKIGLRLNKNIFRIIYAYIVGSIRQYKYNKTLILKQNKIMRSNRLKILIVSHPYIVYDKYLSSNIINYLKNEDIDLLYSDRMNRKKKLFIMLKKNLILYIFYILKRILVVLFIIKM